MIPVGALAVQIVHTALMIAAAPLVAGVIPRIEGVLLGRVGPPVLQPYRMLQRLARKQPVVAENASFVFTSAPLVCFAAMAVAAFLVPSFALGMLSAPIADLLAIIGLIALARCALALAAMDVGTGFGGIGASRTMAYAAFAEPALLLVILVLAAPGGTTNLDAIAALLRESPRGVLLSVALTVVPMTAVALVENGRMPVGDPAAQREFGMAQQAMVLEYSARDLALLEAAGMLRLLVWLDLIATVFLPFGLAPPDAGPLDWLIGLLAWAAKMLALACCLAGLEISASRMRLFRIPQFLGMAALLGLLAAMLVFISQGSA